MRRSTLIGLVGTLSVATAAAGQAPRMTDSAGVRIIWNSAVAQSPARFTLAPTADLVIGGTRDDPAQELSNRANWPTAIRLDDGRVVASNATELRFLDSRGATIKVVGRDGAGPGEFRQIQSVCRFRGDSLVVWDDRLKRVSIWTGAGALVREFTPAGRVVLGGCFADGAVVTEGIRIPSARDDVPTRQYVVVSSNGKPEATFGPLPSSFYSGSAWRDVHVAMHGDQIFFGDGIEMGYRVLDRRGKLLAIVRTADRPVPITDANLDQFKMMCVPNKGKCEAVPTKMRTWPMYKRLMADDAGRVWLLTGSGESDAVWTGFGSDGTVLGRLRMPAFKPDQDARIVAYGRNTVTLADRDEDGSRRLSLFRLVERGQ